MKREEMLARLEDIANDYALSAHESSPRCASDLRLIKQELRKAWRRSEALVDLLLWLAERIK